MVGEANALKISADAARVGIENLLKFIEGEAELEEAGRGSETIEDAAAADKMLAVLNKSREKDAKMVGIYSDALPPDSGGGGLENVCRSLADLRARDAVFFTRHHFQTVAKIRAKCTEV